MPGAVAELIAKDFGGPVTVREREVTVADTPATRILGNNPERLAYIIVNQASGDLRLRFSAAGAGGSSFIPISASGGSLSVDVREDFTLPTHEVFGDLLTDPGAQVYVVEIIRDSGK